MKTTNARLLMVLTVMVVLMMGTSQPLKALEYTLVCEATADTVVLDSVFVENMTQDTVVKLGGQDILKLVDVIVGMSGPSKGTEQRLILSPNPSSDGRCTMTFESETAQEARLDVVDLAGRVLLKQSIRLEKGRNSYTIDHLSHGLAYVVVTTSQQRYSGKVVSTAPEVGLIQLVDHQFNAASQPINDEQTQKATWIKASNVQQGKVVYLYFEPGDWLRITALAEGNKSVRVVAPAGDDTLAFPFYRCVDGDGYAYPTVTIGRQVWMAENLRASSFNDSTPLFKIADPEQWSSYEAMDGAFGWYDNDSLNALPFGAMYNGFAVLSGKLAPKGWHVATANDYESLFETVDYDVSTLMANWTAGWDTLPLLRYDSTGFAALGAGVFGWGEYNGRLEYASFWTSTMAEMPSAPRPRPDGSVPAKGSYYAFLATAEMQTWGVGLSGNTVGNAMSVRCVMNQAPTVITGMIQAGRATRAGLEGRVISDGGEGVVESGFCWSRTNPVPTMADSVVVVTEQGYGIFCTVLTGLEAGATYYVRAYAKNGVGLAYGAVKMVSPVDAGTVTDVDGQVYPTVQIGGQIWMAENLRVTRFNDGTLIPEVNSPTAWYALTTAARCLYDSLATVGVDGYLYNQLAVQTQKLAPKGWHVPTATEWDTLLNRLRYEEDDDEVVAWKFKTADNIRWKYWIGAGNDVSGFSATPAGRRLPTGETAFWGECANWWSTTRYAWDTNPYYEAFVVDNYAFTTQFEPGCGLSVRCLKDYPARLITGLKAVRQTTASIGVQVVEAGGILKRLGVCLSSTDSLPDVINAQVATFDSTRVTDAHWLELDTLTPGTTYYLRSFAENSTGVSYGPLICFNTQSTDSVVDADGNVYHTIKIGSQTWMVENLKTTKYNDGTAIGGLSGYHSTTPGYSTYANNSSNKDTYGLLYNWYAVNTGKLAPEGWRVPSQADWQALLDYLGGEEAAGGILKEAGTTHWESPNTDAMDWGFAALPGGTRDGSAAIFRTLRSRGWWWTSTPATQDYNAYTMGLVSWMGSAYIGEGYKSDAFSVRCIKNE